MSETKDELKDELKDESASKHEHESLLLNLKLNSLHQYYQPLIDLGFDSFQSFKGFTPEKFVSVIEEKIINNTNFEEEYHFKFDSASLHKLNQFQKALYNIESVNDDKKRMCTDI